MEGEELLETEGVRDSLRLRGAVRWVRHGCGALAFAGVISFFLKALFSDSVFPLNYNYYIPAILMIPGTVLALALSYLRGPVALVLLSATVVLGTWDLHRQQPNLFFGGAAPSPVESNGPELTVLSYNVMAYNWGEERIVEGLSAMDFDVLCLVEGSFGNRVPPRLSAALGDEYHWTIGYLLAIASRYPIVESRHLVSTADAQILRAVLDVEGQHVAIILADINPPFRRNDRNAFDRLYAVTHSETLPAILAGDLNAPRGSYHLGRATEGWTDVFSEDRRKRYLATWPSVLLPLFQLDYILHNGEFQTLEATIPDIRWSDHRPVEARLQLLPRE